jgi:putative membrane protein
MNIWVDAYGWPVPPQVLLVCLIAEILYFRGWRLLFKAEQKKNARARSKAVLTGASASHYALDSWLWRSIYFLGAILAFLVASSAPIDILSSRLFWMHMIQHLLIIVVMAPLLVASAPIIPLWLGLPRWAHRLIKRGVRLKIRLALYRLVGWLRQPAISCALLLIGVWGWHWPPLYDLALTNAAIHDWLEHSTFLAVSALFWTQIIPSQPLRPRLGYLGRLGCVAFAMAQNVVLAALIGFSQVPLYAPYAHLFNGLGGLSPVFDQQLGAGIMWTFGDLPFGMAFASLVHLWLASQSDEQREIGVGEKQSA